MTLTLPKYDALMFPTLRALDALGGSATVEEIRSWLVEALGLTEAQMDAAHEKSGSVIMPHRMAWARSYLKIAGMVSSGGKGLWVLNDAGRHALTGSEAALKAEVKKLVAAYNALRRAEAAADDGDDDSATEEEAEWTDALLAKLRTMDPGAFERLAQRLLRESGFVKVEVTGKSGDGGIDGSGVLRMNLISFQVLFQCKRYAGSVPAGTVRDFRGAMQGRADKGLIITTGTFTADARKEATRDGAPAIDLIDGEALCQLLKERGLGVQVRQVVREEVTVVPEFFDEI
ncbi:restriction endonuclease [Sphingomonas sp. CJ99]